MASTLMALPQTVLLELLITWRLIKIDLQIVRPLIIKKLDAVKPLLMDLAEDFLIRPEFSLSPRMEEPRLHLQRIGILEQTERAGVFLASVVLRPLGRWLGPGISLPSVARAAR
jgi:hypothetical protein